MELTVRSHEVVKSHEECGQGYGSVEVFEASTRSRVELVGTVQAFHELLEDAVSFAFGVDVFQTNDGAFGDHVRLGSVLGSVIVGHDGGVVRRQSIGDELAGNAFGGVRRTVASVEQSQSRLGAPVVREVVAADGPSVLSDDEPSVVGFAFDLDVSFIRRTGTAWGGAVGIDKSGQIAGRSVDVVDDGLMRDGNVKDAF